MIKYFLLAFCLAYPSIPSFAQPFRINEVMASNGGIITDSDGDTPDWIEFYNAGTAAMNLNGYGLSDKKDEPFQWVFPDYVVNPGEYLLVFASGKDQRELPVNWNTLISSGDQWKYMIPASEPTTNWRTNAYSDSNWLTGKSGFGFADGDDATVVTVTKSIFIRKKFTLTDVATIRKMVLHMDYDDGFVAYLNGVEIARAQMDGKGALPRFDATSSGLHEALIYQKLPPEKFEISNPASVLKTGENILAIQIHNAALNSSDLSAIPFLSVETSTIHANPRIIDILKLERNELHTNFKISADGESVYLTNLSSVLTDSVRVGVIPLNASYGRISKNPTNWAIFTTSTPGIENLGEDVGVPVFSLPAGIYQTAQKLSLRAPNKSDTIYYTLNGSEPTRSSSRVIREISIPTSKVLKARILKSGMMPGKVVTNSYIIYNTNKLPVVSISMDSLVLFDEVTGMYVDGPNINKVDMPHYGANYWMDWERACHFEMIETTGNKVIDQDAGVKIFGNWSRTNAQKSLVIHSRKSYGTDQIKYKLFENRPFDEFKNIVLRNSGNDWNNTMFRDGLISSLSMELDFDQMAYRPSIIFLNGKYWGIQNIREKIDEYFIASNNGVNPSDVIMLELNGVPLIGTADDWWKMYNFLDQNSMITTANYEQVASQIDISSFIDYFASQIFYANWDWPGNNIKYWKTTDPASRWRWILFDADFSLGIWNSKLPSENSLASATDPNHPEWPNPPWSTLMLRKLLENREFRNQFVTRFEDLMNSTFLPDRIIKAIDEKSARIDGEIGLHLKRWGGDSKAAWLGRVQEMRVFTSARPENVFTHIRQKFFFSNQQIITVNTDSVAGTIQLNSLKLNKFPWKGAYFPNIAITVTAIPKAGYRFLKWEGVTTNSSSETIKLAPKANLILTAVFESDGSHFEDIVINEISFNNAAQPDPGDWVEIYNKGENDINLSGWKLTDSDSTHQFVFAPNTWIKANEYLVVSNDLTKMNAVFGSVINQVGPFEFGLGNMTDAVRLYSQTNELIDEVNYSNVVPWQSFDLTELWSLELTNPTKDNNSGQNWVFSEKYGTPGLRNTPYLPDAIDDLPLAQNIPALSQNYPNPFSDGTYIEFELDKPGKYRVSLLDVNGRTIRIFNDDNQLSTLHSLYWDGTDNSGKPVTSGVYFYRLECNGFSEMKRMVKI